MEASKTMTSSMMMKTIAALAATLMSAGAQAAHLDIVSGAVAGGTLARIQAGAQPDQFQGAVVDASGPGQILGFDLGGGQGAAGGAAVEWAHLASLEADVAQPGRLNWQATSSAAWTLDGVGQITQLHQGASTSLSALLRVVSDGEASGSAVRVDLSGSFESLIDTNLAWAFDHGAVSLSVRDSLGQVLAQVDASALAGGRQIDLSFASRVGDVLSLSLVQTVDAGLSAEESVAVGTQRTLGTSSLFEGHLSVTAVPEASSCVLALAGLAVAGVAARARRRQA